MVVGKGHIFHQNFSHDADPGFYQLFLYGQIVKFLHDLSAQFGIAAAGMLFLQCIDATLPPLPVESISRSRLQFIGPHTVQAAHQ